MTNNLIKVSDRPKVLIAPLDWGLGHATRCVPIINELIRNGCQVVIAADKQILTLLKKEFPTLQFLLYPGYEMAYSRDKRWLPLKLIFQIPKLASKIIRETGWLKRMIGELKPDAVISDNRLGLYSHRLPCIYITHQLLIKTGSTVTDKIAQKIHSFFIKKYTQCWVPDLKDNGLAGELSHPNTPPRNVQYIGPLSRFNSIKNTSVKYDLLISLSGPEPQRSIFEKIILAQLTHFSGTALLVRGLPSSQEKLQPPNPTVTIANHLPAKEFNLALEQSELIISRSGYTSIMDFVKLQKKAILVPTPGQTEQEYLAKYLFSKRYFYATTQHQFNLSEALSASSTFDFQKMDFATENFKSVISEFVHSLKSINFASQ